MIPQDFIQALLGRVDIVDVIDRHVKLKKSGANFSACCPFHNEKTPSFSVSPSKQFYHCFGCGVHGTAISFLMEYSGQSFPDAVRELAESVGMQVPQESARDDAPRREQHRGLADLMVEALGYYRAQLKKSPAAIEYLKKRGLSGEIAARYGIGYAPEGWQNLQTVFPDYATSALVKDTGLAIENDEGRRYDRFRDRVMFPILDGRGNVIGFGGRIIGAGEPKYLNSPETPLFEKGRELYGLYQARRAIRDSSTVIVVEGYMDVVALAQSGIENAVATLGTSTTPYHLQKLLRMAENIVFCFDGDAAGRKAAWRALEVSLPLLADGKAVSFLFLPAEDDPDTFVRRLGKEAFLAELARAKPLSQFLLDELASRADLASEEGRARMVSLAKPLVAQIEAPALGLLIRRRLAEVLGVSREEFAGVFPQQAAPRSPAPAVGRAPRRTRSLESRLLARLLAQPLLARGVDPTLIPASAPESAALGAVIEFLRESGAANSAQVSAHFEGTEHAALIEHALSDQLLVDAGEGIDLAAEVVDIQAKLRMDRDKREMEALMLRMAAGDAAAEEEYRTRRANAPERNS
jgi:DNA primase